MQRSANRSSRAAPAARRGRSGGSFVIGLFVGLVLGLAIALGVAFYLNKTPLPFLGKSKPPATKDGKEADAPKAVAGMPQGGTKGAAEKDRPKFDFYKILPGGEEPVTERELKDADGDDAGS